MDYLPYFLKKYDLDLRPNNCKELDVESAKSVLYPGAQIAASNPYEHYHHGIVIDQNAPEISIIHLWGPDKENSHVQRTTLPIFLAGGPDKLGKRTRHLYLVNYDGDTLEKQQQTVKTAEELLGKADEVVYDMANLNCESFANFCRTGSWTSQQIETLKYLMVEKADDLCQEMQNPDEKNRKMTHSVLKSIPHDDLNPAEKVVHNQLCQHYTMK